MSGKKYLLQIVYLSLIVFMVFATGCALEPTTPTNGQNPDTSGEPVAGGTLRIIRPTGPNVLSNVREIGPTDVSAVFPAAESLMAVTAKHKTEPLLAESFTEDPDNLRITFKIRKGVKFHDGSELTAEVVKWNYEMMISVGRFDYLPLLKSIEATDRYTLVFHLNEWNNQLLDAWTVYHIFSKEAFETAANGDVEKGLEWARTNAVGTGPFKLENWTRDVGMTWVRFDDYWRGPAYLDRVEIRYIPEAATAAVMMEAGEADIWLEASSPNISELVAKGFIRKESWGGIQYSIIPNSATSTSPLADKRVREAIEFAINKQALCDAVGYGYLTPISTVVPPGHWGSDRTFREYHPDKAKALLAEAGYPSGLTLKLLAMAGSGGRNESAEAIANFLNEVGLEIELDIADAGRFFGSVWGNGWDDLVLMFSGTDHNYLISAHRWWSHSTSTQLKSLARPQELLDLFNVSLSMRTMEEKQAITEEIVHFLAEQALVIPLYHSPHSFLHNGKVHTTYLEQGNTRWDYYDMWLEE